MRSSEADEHRLGEGRARVHEVLAVVEDQQQLTRAQPIEQRLLDGAPGFSGTSSTRATTAASRSALAMGARSTNHAPCAKVVTTRPPTCCASRVLPEPPAPVRVTRRADPSRPASAHFFLAADERRQVGWQVVRAIGRKQGGGGIAVAFQDSQIRQQRACALIAAGRVLGQALPDDAIELLGHGPVRGAEAFRFAVAKPVHHLEGRRAAEWQPPRGRLIEQDAEREEVGTMIDPGADRLLGAHVGRSAHHHMRTVTHARVSS